ncbi:Proteinase inhibitor I25, cystatin, conserved region [Trema orientale]|uniref:Proteinase inhibitor I25, cystatin, conserved region n=1 Tax=Trema orientale TaxID=63057 RepID=A0A2P5F2B6_TREOI|nr:Proteinase inhibitor I25, cystatin, conserved region [Trema orientale]
MIRQVTSMNRRWALYAPDASTDEEYANYMKRVSLLRHTQGFYAGNWKNEEYRDFCGGILKFGDGGSLGADAAIYALNSHGETKKRGVGLRRVIRANFQAMAGTMLYLTFEGTDGKFYEAKVFVELDGSFDLEFIRPAVHYPNVDPDILRKYDCPPEYANY